MYPRLPAQSAITKNEYRTTASSTSNHRSSYPQPQVQADNRKYHTPTDQLMIGFDKFIRRYESRCCHSLIMLLFIFS